LPLVLCTTIAAQTSTSFDDLASDFASRIATAVAASEPLSVASLSGDANDGAANGQVQREITRLLVARGLRIVAPATGTTAVTIACTANLRERTCVAEIVRRDSREIVTVAKVHAADDGPGPRTVALEAVPLFAQRAAILDVAIVSDSLLVLEPAAIGLYRRAGEDWQRVESRAIVSSRIPPRDVRGRLTTAGGAVTAYLPGAVCRGPVDLATLACAEEREPWPLSIDNTGIDATRNYFHTPEGVTFFGAASLDADAAARSALVDVSGQVLLLDDSRRTIGVVGMSDDVAALTASCRPGAYIVLSSKSQDGDTDSLRLWRVVAKRLVPAGTPLAMPGRVTALWAAPGAHVATAVIHDLDAGRYEAFQLQVSCDR